MSEYGTQATCEKSLPLSREAFQGKVLLLLLLLILSRRRGGARRSKLLQVVLQEADFNAATRDALWLGIAGRSRRRCITHADEINPVDRNVVVQRQIADDRLGHLLRVGNRHLSMTRREALDFDDVATLALQRGGHFIESVLGVLA